MNRIKKAIASLGLIGLLYSGNGYTGEVQAKEAEAKIEEVGLAEYCRNNHREYEPKPEIKKQYDALEHTYNKECHEQKNCQPSIDALKKIIEQDPNFCRCILKSGNGIH